MRRLLLLRHAKSSWANVGQSDFDRPLAPRGIRAAPLVARHMVEQDLVPDAVICSPARRAKSTMTLLFEVMPRPESVHFEPTLYEAGPERLREIVRACDDRHETVLVIGHNPTMEDAALGFTADDGSAMRRSLGEKYPTGALAVIEFPGDSWSEADWGAGVLRAFVRPRDLAAS